MGTGNRPKISEMQQIHGHLHLKRGRRLGKYRLEKRLGMGGYCEVWKARDRVEDIWVALKIPLLDINGQRDNQTVLREVRLVAQLRHPHILPVRNADIIDGHAVLATELSVGTLADRSKPMAPRRLMSTIMQVLEGLAYAHHNRVLHCDITPGNVFLFPDGRVALGDFGISLQLKGRMVTIDDYGTPGYVAPEQAYGHPNYCSDCFSVGLILYEYLTGCLPRWPFHWPFRGHERLRERTNLAMLKFLKQSLAVDPKRRFVNAKQMLTAFSHVLPTQSPPGTSMHISPRKAKSWQHWRREEFVNRYRRVLHHFCSCVKCGEPIAEVMKYCPWCGSDKNRFDSLTSFDYYCPTCRRGVSPEWRYCPWCYSAGFDPLDTKKNKEIHYDDYCKYCRGRIMHFMRYCPWCHRKVRRPWQTRPFPEICGHCHWSVDANFWSYCPWCRQSLNLHYSSDPGK